MVSRKPGGSWWYSRSWFQPFIQEPLELREVDQKTTSLPYTLICLCALSIVGFATQLVVALEGSSWALIPIGLWLLASLWLAIGRPRTASILLIIIFITIFAVQLSLFSAQWTSTASRQMHILNIVSAALPATAVIILVNMPLRDPSLSRAEISPVFSCPTDQLRSPEDNLTLWQWMTVSWMGPLIKIGNKRQLNDEDVWQLGYEFKHRHLHDTFRDLKGTVVRRILRANWIDLAILTILALVELGANYSAPLILQQLLKAMQNVHREKRPAVTFALLTLLVRLIAAQSGVFSLWFSRRAYERARGEIITMLYEKTLNRKIIGSAADQEKGGEDEISDNDAHSKQGLDDDEDTEWSDTQSLLDGDVKMPDTVLERPTTRISMVWKILTFPFRSNETVVDRKMPAGMGKILNMMRNDAYEVAQRFWEFQTLINKPLGLILSLVFVWRLIGWSCLFGLALVLFAQVLNAIFARIIIRWEKVRRRATDGKLQQISQYVEAIRHLRWYGWHPTWLERIMQARQEELNLKVIISLWNIAIRSVNMFASGMLPVASFYAYTVLAHQELRIDVAFPALQLFSLLQINLREIPNLITVLLNASVAVGRIEDFMCEPDKIDTDDTGPRLDERLEVEHASFAWPGSSQDVLHDLTLSFPQGLTVIFGPVAAGKTALLQALLGELDLREGALSRPGGPVGYCAQTPWLESMSIRENILFNSPYEESRYKQTLEACALVPDLASFKHGDLSNIGENGIGLSGGQRARVALARAVYSRAKYLLVDDPLSGLDQQTAEWIVAKCFSGDLLRARTLVLVTHRTDLFRHVSKQLIELSNGFAHTHKDDSALLEGLSMLSPQSSPIESRTGAGHEAEETIAVPDKFVEEEHRVHGGVQAAVYWEYIKAGKLKWWFLAIFFAALTRLTLVTESWFLKEWGEAYGKIEAYLFALQSLRSDVYVFSNPLTGLFDRFPDPGLDVTPWLWGLFILIILEATTLSLSMFMSLILTYSAGRQMFRDIMKRISNATFRFYDVTPVGRLMNRLTSDVGTIDGNISDQFMTVAWQSLAWVSSIIVIASVTPVFLIFTVLFTIAFIVIFLQFLPTSQSLRRLEMVSLSPLMSNFGALLNGLMTVRAFCAQSQFQNRVIVVTDAFQKMDHFYWSLQAWLMYRFDTLSACSTFILTILAIYSGLSPGLTAFALVAAGRLVVATHSLCKQYGQLQLDFVSVERVVELLHLEQEPPGTIEPPAWWPSRSGDIVFENVTIRYAPHLDPALSDVSFELKGGSNVAVTGRTGSGKSTLALALLATVTPDSGRILIDGIDIAKVDKQALRARVTFLAQDPILFPGSMRHNLDPMEEHSDAACEAVLARVCERHNWTLSTTIDTGGQNLSQGQRQLVGLARAILRQSAIVIMDEATASIDEQTAWEIQRVLKEEMKGSTVITIAHRTSAVRGAESSIMLAKGKLVERTELGSQSVE